MLLSVRDVINIDSLKNCHFLTAVDSLDKRYVESISVIEIPVDNFVHKNEFVLSTTIGCGHDPKLLLEFVHDIIKADAAALAIAVGHYIKEIPEDVIALAEEHDFPIIEVPWELRFSDIIKSVLSTINNWHSTSLRKTEEMQKLLLHLFLRKADLTQAAEVMHQKIGRPVVIINKEGKLLGNSNNSTSLILLWDKASQTKLPFEPVKTSVHLQSDIKFIQYEQNSIIQVTIRTAYLNQGYLLFSLPPDSELHHFLSNDLELLLEHAATSFALWFQRENTIKETEMRLRDDFVWSLTKDRIESWDIVLSRAKLLGFDLSLPYVCIMGFPENINSIFQASPSKKDNYEDWLQNVVREIEEEMIHSVKTLQKKVMITYQQEKLIIYLEILDQKVNHTVNSFLDIAEKKIKNLYPQLTISWGIGEAPEGLESFKKSYNDAKIALEIGSSQKGPGLRNTYASTGIYRVLQCLSKHDEMIPIVQSTIGIIVKFDKEKHLDLTHTLKVHIRNRYIVTHTARELNLHRQSLLYRLEKVEALTGLSLSDPDDLFLLDLSIKLWSTGKFQFEKES